MRKTLARHPDEERLLRYLDGELKASQSGEIRLHLQTCWECRAEAGRIEQTIAECVRYRKDVLAVHLPPPPAAWMDLSVRLAEIDNSLARPSLAARFFSWLPALNAKTWAVAIVLIAVALMAIYRLRDTPSVQAATLLQKSEAYEKSRPYGKRHIRFRTGAPGRETASLRPAQALFVAAHYDWADPLSARAFQNWRNQLADREDNVIKQPDGFLVRTSTHSSELAQASLSLRGPALRPVEELLEFSDHQWVEIREVEETPVESTAVRRSGDSRPDTPPVADLHQRESLPQGPAPATVGDELSVMAALHGIGADLGDPIEVSRSGPDVLVTGVGIAPDRQREVREAIGARPHVVIRFSDTAPPQGEPSQTTPEPAAGAGLAEFQARIVSEMGGRAQFEQAASELLDLSDQMVSRAHALRRLAERFPIDAEAAMTAEDRRMLASLRQGHSAALAKQISDLRRALLPVLGKESDRDPASGPAPAPWQPAAEDAFQCVRRIDKLLAVMFGAAPAGSPVKDVPTQLRTNLIRLQADLASSLNAEGAKARRNE